jgi:drug/metabolite transporter (DMT)-like permease
LFVISIVMTVGNKLIMIAFKYPNLVTLMQNGTCVLVLATCKALGLADIKPISQDQWVTFAVTAVLLATQIVSMLYALPLVAIATTVAARTVAMVVVAAIDYTFFDKTFTFISAGALVVATAGMIIYALNDVNYDAVGYLWLLLNSVATVISTFWNKVYITQYKKNGLQTPQGISLIQQAETLPLVAAMALHNNEFVALSHLGELTITVKAVLFVTCIGGLVISVAYTQVYALSSGTSVMLATTIYRAVAIVFGHVLFHTVLSSRQVGGLVVCIIGGVAYSLAPSGPPLSCFPQRSTHRPGAKQTVPFVTANQVWLFCGIFLLSLVLVISFREHVWENGEENVTLQGDKLKEQGLQATLSFNLQKIERLTAVLQHKTLELKRLKTLMMQNKGG